MVIHAPQEEEVASLHEMEMKLRDPGLWFNQKKPLLKSNPAPLSILIKWICSYIVIGFLQAKLWVVRYSKVSPSMTSLDTTYFCVSASCLRNERKKWGYER